MILGGDCRLQDEIESVGVERANQVFFLGFCASPIFGSDAELQAPIYIAMPAGEDALKLACGIFDAVANLQLRVNEWRRHNGAFLHDHQIIDIKHPGMFAGFCFLVRDR